MPRIKINLGGVSKLEGLPSIPGREAHVQWDARPVLHGERVSIRVNPGLSLIPGRTVPAAPPKTRPRGALPDRKKLLAKRRARAAKTETP